MEYINIYFAGLPGVGKSTTINSLTGTQISKKNTTKQLDFEIDPTYNGDIIKINNGNTFYRTPRYDTSFFLKEWVMCLHDTVGVSHDVVKKDKTVFSFKKEKYKECDILCFVFDINTFEEKWTENEKIMFEMTERMRDKNTRDLKDHTFCVCILNKCDSLIFRGSTPFMNNSDNEKFNKCSELLKKNKYNIIVPLCAKDAGFYSAGCNGFFDSDNENFAKVKYTETIEANGPEKLLIKHGLKNLVDVINNFITSNKDHIINKHILHELKEIYCKCSFSELTEYILKLKTLDIDIYIQEIIEIVKNGMNSMIPKKMDNKDNALALRNSVDEFQSVFYQKTGIKLDILDEINNLINQMETDEYLSNLKKEWNIEHFSKLYKMDKLDRTIHYESFKNYITEQNFAKLLIYILIETKCDPEFIFDSFDAFLSKYPGYIILFKNSDPFSDTLLELVRINLLLKHGNKYICEVAKIGFDVGLLNKMKKVFSNIKLLYNSQMLQFEEFEENNSNNIDENESNQKIDTYSRDTLESKNSNEST